MFNISDISLNPQKITNFQKFLAML